MTRAYSVLKIKAVNEGARTVKGIATTPSVDRAGDIIDPLGVRFANPLPFLWQHRHDQPIGTCEFGKPTANGIPFTATIANPTASGVLKDRCDEAWQSIELGLVRAVSIGFRPIEYSYIEGGGIRYSETEVFELSAVTIPAQADATMAAIKSADAMAKRANHSDRVVKIGRKSASAPAANRVVKLTADEKRRAKILGQALVRAASRRRVGIPLPVVKL